MKRRTWKLKAAMISVVVALVGFVVMFRDKIVGLTHKIKIK